MQAINVANVNRVPYDPERPYMEFGPEFATWNEKQFQRSITHELMGFFGWTRHYHNLYAVGSDTGFPDLVLVNPRRQHGILYLEVKGKDGLPSRAQVEWMQDLQSACQHAYIVYPEDLWLVQGLFKGDFDHPSLSASGMVIDPHLLNLRYYRTQLWTRVK